MSGKGHWIKDKNVDILQQSRKKWIIDIEMGRIRVNPETRVSFRKHEMLGGSCGNDILGFVVMQGGE